MQVFINYGPHDNRKLLLEYGFILPHNLHNTVAFSEDLIYSVVLPDIFGISRKKREIIAINKLHKDLCCSEGSGLSWNLLVLLRVLAMKEDHFKRHWQRVLTGEFLGDDVENRVSQWRQNLIERVLISYELDEKNIAKFLSSDIQRSENAKLALSLRNQEKHILQNALDLLKISWWKSMESRKGQPLKILYSDFYSETVLDIVQDNNDAQFLNTSLLFDVF